MLTSILTTNYQKKKEKKKETDRLYDEKSYN